MPDLDSDFVLWGFALSIVLTVVVSVHRALKIASRKKQVLAVATTSGLASAKDGDAVRVRGKVDALADAHATLEGPLSGRKLVWSRLTFRAELGGEGLLTWRDHLREVLAKDFTLVDAAGHRAVVAIAEAGDHATVCPDDPYTVRTAEEAPLGDKLIELMTAREAVKDLIGDKKEALVAMRTYEEALAPGQEIEVIGKVVKRGDATRIEPLPGLGLLVAHGDLHELAAKGDLWEKWPRR